MSMTFTTRALHLLQDVNEGCQKAFEAVTWN